MSFGGVVSNRRTGIRLQFLDGLRGLAAMQVMIGHYAGVFLRGYGSKDGGINILGLKLAWLKAPLFFLNDGFFAVYVFFMISGMVLTLAFERSNSSIFSIVVQRFVRLGGPMLFALLFSALVMGILPEAHIQAADVIGTTSSLKAVLHAPYSLVEAFRQAVTSGMLLGYREATILPDLIRNRVWDDSNSQSLDPPLWTIHFEFWGSIFTIFLVSIRKYFTRFMYIMSLFILTILLSRHTFVAFIIGHQFAIAAQHQSWNRITKKTSWQVVGVIACGAAVWACEIPAWPWVSRWYAIPGPFKVYGDVNLQSMMAAFFGFSGVMLVGKLQEFLSRSIPQWIGRMSFSIYLLHFPILFSIVPLVFLNVQWINMYRLEVLTSSIIGVAVTLTTSMFFERWVDQSFINISKTIRSKNA